MSSSRAGAGAAPAIAISQATIRFGGRALVSDLAFRLPGGQTTCLLGPSGVGKTTLLKLIAGLLPPDADAHVEADDGRPLAGRIAYMAQQDLLLPWLSVLDNICLGFRLRGDGAALARARDEARDLLERVGLAPWANALPAALSGGMRQRAALLRTLMENRPVVVMDEPFAQLDAITRLELQDLAARLLAGRTVALVTHDALEALRLGHRVHVLAGRPVVIGEPIEPIGQPPRPADNAALLGMQAALLRELAAARQSMLAAA
jgi:putative hydroxymethylpyrimidine transport system ATP-binding protein